MTRAKILVVLAFSVACTTEKTPPADTTIVVSPDSSVATPPAAPPAAPETTSTDTGSSSNTSGWKVGNRGIGPISAGMTLAQANAATGNRLVTPTTMENECGFASLKDTPDVMFMVEKGVISRVDVARASTITTEAGAKIGDTENQIKALYPGVAVQPHKYTDGHYLVVTPSATADQNYRLIFETDGQKVLRYRSGRMPAVQYVEGCS